MQKIGIFDSGVETPEEIVMAAGFTPYRFFGDPTLQPDRANEHIPPTHCIWTRNLLEQAIKGLNENIVGIIGTHGCDRTNREFDIWIECLNLDFMFFLNSPRKRDNLALNFFINDLKELILRLEEGFNIEITRGKLKDAIIKTNKIRKLLKEISNYRKKLVLKGSEFHELVKNAQYQDKNQVLENLEKKVKIWHKSIEKKQKEAKKEHAELVKELNRNKKEQYIQLNKIKEEKSLLPQALEKAKQKLKQDYSGSKGKDLLSKVISGLKS